MAKKKYRQSQAESRKHQHISRRVQRQQRLLLYATVAFFALLVGILGYGILDQAVLRYHRPVAKVNGDVIRGKEFVIRTRMHRAQLIQQTQQILQFAQLFGNDPQSAQYFQSQLQPLARQLNNPTELGRQVLNSLIEERLIVQQAKQMGITVTDEESDQELQGIFGYYPNGTPTPEPAPTTLPTSTLSPTQLALVTLTPTPTMAPTATPNPEATAEGSPTPTVIPPTPTPYTQEAYQQNLAKYLEQMQSQYEVDETYLRYMIAASLYRRKLMDIVTKDLPRTREEVWARHILVKDRETAMEVLKKLSEGVDWNDLVAEYSQDAATVPQGGDLGWFPRGVMVPAFEKVAFQLKVGEISPPVQTDYGWHIIQVLGHEQRPVSEGDYQRLREQKFQDWLSEVRAKAEIEIHDGWQNIVPQDPAIPQELLPFLGQQ
ncbi:MAG TPA: hypothetical protein G4O04_08295 [Anaerolineae bacterium]|nr:hypothetical protein [Anaerolineae bacterium]HID84614.1 hypothetical protein [Anaerolineales bacterium]HIQ07943.1 hypothetical protein [Anaerolineaceae bacterium]